MSALLRFDAVSLRRDGRLLFEQLSFALEPGNRLQVTGPNGSGKSSLLRLAAGLLRAEQGRIERSALALADDHAALDRELPLRSALAFWGGTSTAAMATLGLANLASVPVRLLSSGQLKRATLARVVGSGAPLWLLDEPLNALDSDGADCLSRAIDSHVAAGGSIVAASHQAMPGTWRTIALQP